MEIFINGKALEVTLEKERTLQEVMKNLENWTEKENFVIKEVKIDGKVLDRDAALESEEEIQGINVLELTVAGFVEKVEEVYPVLKDYLTRFKEAITQDQESFVADKREKIEGLVWIVESSSLIAKSLGVYPRHIFSNGRSLEEILNFFEFSVQNLTQNIHDSNFFYQYFNEGIASRLTILEELLVQLLGFYNCMLGEHTVEFKAKIQQEAKTMQELMANLPELVQDGRDQDALAFLQKMMGFFESIFLLLSQAELVIESKYQLEEQKEAIIAMFQDIYEAFKTQDVVTVSDIVEYELTEKLTALLELFPEGVAAGA